MLFCSRKSTARFTLLSLATLFMLCAVAPAVAQQRAMDPEVEKILRERVKVLREVADMLTDLHKTGRSDFERVMLAERAVIEAELELAPTAADRIKLLEKLVENVSKLEKLVEQRATQGIGSTLDLRVATAIRLRAQADLLMAKKSAAR